MSRYRKMPSLIGYFGIFLLGLIIFAVLTGCGPKEGRVVNKHWKPDLSYWGTQITCTSTNSGTRCTSSPHWYYNPPVWYLVLETPEGKIKDKSVKRSVYYSTNVGDYYREK